MEVEVTEETPNESTQPTEAEATIAAVATGAAIAQEAQRQASQEAQTQNWNGQEAESRLVSLIEGMRSEMRTEIETIKSQVSNLGTATAEAIADLVEDETDATANSQDSQGNTSETARLVEVPETIDNESQPAPKRQPGALVKFLHRARIV